MTTAALPAETSSPPPAGAATRPPLDLDHLQAITLADPVLEREIIGLFGEQAAAALRALLSPDASTDLRAAVHRLAGAARAIGAWELAAAAETLESAEAVSDATAAALSRRMAEVVDYVTLRLAG